MDQHDPMQPGAARPRLYLQVATRPAQAGRHAGNADAGAEGDSHGSRFAIPLAPLPSSATIK